MTTRDLRRLALCLWEELGGDRCTCQRSDIPHWCTACQTNIDVILTAFLRVRATIGGADEHRVHCMNCGTSVSNATPVEMTVRAWVICPECIARDGIAGASHGT